MKSFFENLFGGPNPPWVIVFIDEIEKALAGGSSDRGDTSGVTQDAIKMLLICMQDYKWRGQICVGPPGTAKTFFAECLAATYKRPFIALDLGAAKGGIVGQSEQRIRDVMRTLLAIGGIGGCYFVATCNKLNVISPEMKRRFSYPGAPIFFDLPDQEERVSIGKLQTKIYQLEDDPELWASLHGYSGANIGTICALSRDLRMPMRKAAGTVISALETDPDGIAELRTLASGKFRSASYEGP
jgi:SpoVK/Ycf46/Vps4 family AAA+-type ATPase